MRRDRNSLVIHGPHPEVKAFLQRLEEKLTDGWRRDRELEARLRANGVGGDDRFCFTCSDAAGRPAAAVLLQPAGFEQWRVFNILPLGKKTLTDEEYNQILEEFDSRFIGPLSHGCLLRSEIIPPQLRLEDYLWVGAAEALRTFSGKANRQNLQRSDRELWQRFVLRAHEEDSIIDPAFLKEWLASEGWPEKICDQLTSDYETARSLLLSYDEERRR